MTDLEQAQALLEAAGWEVTRPPFDDPYEILYRRMQSVGLLERNTHPTDNPMLPTYDWNEWDTLALRFLKEHFTIKEPPSDHP